MKHHLKKLASLMLALAMVLALGTTAFAVNGQDTSAYYYQGDAEDYETSEAIAVYVTIESFRTRLIGGSSLLKTRIPVTLTPDGTQTFTVTDAFVALQNDQDNGITFLDSRKEAINAGDSYVMYVRSGSTDYGPSSQYSMDGWMVRINNKFAILGDNPAYGGLYGAAINTTYLTDGDDIHFYMDNTTSTSTCVKYTALSTSYTDGTLTVNVTESHNWFDSSSPYTWHITDFTPYSVSNASFTIYKNSDGSVVETVSNKSGTTINIVVDLDAGETYTVVMSNAFKTPSTSLNYTSASAVFQYPAISEDKS